MGHTRGMVTLAAALAAPLAAAACLRTTEMGGCAGTFTSHAYTLGDAAGDTLTAQTCRHLYQFTAAGQTDVHFRVSSPGLETFLQLYDQRGVIVMNSAYTEAVDTATTVRMMLAAGNYALAVSVVTPGQRGAFRLVTDTAGGAVAACAPVWVTTGVVTTQTVTTGDCTQGPAGTSYYTHVYTVVLLARQEANLSESATVFPPGLILSGQGDAMASTLDSTGTTASISTIIVTQGAYTIWVGSSSAGQTGKYTLHVN